MHSTRFVSRPLPAALDTALRERLSAAHAEAPFSPLDPRQTARRVAAITGELGLAAIVYRGGLDLRGVEVDHVWLAAAPDGDPSQPREEREEREEKAPFVVDAAFPLFSQAFVTALRRFVAGDGTREELAVAAEGSMVDDRVLGVFPSPMCYLGVPVWSSR